MRLLLALTFATVLNFAGAGILLITQNPPPRAPSQWQVPPCKLGSNRVLFGSAEVMAVYRVGTGWAWIRADPLRRSQYGRPLSYFTAQAEFHGWPFFTVCTVAHARYRFLDGSTISAGPTGSVQMNLAPCEPSKRMVSLAGTIGVGQHPPRLFPLRIFWPGLAANLTIFSVPIWVLMTLPATIAAMRGDRRRRRQRCMACGYPIGTSDHCSECGVLLNGSTDPSLRPWIAGGGLIIVALAWTACSWAFTGPWDGSRSWREVAAACRMICMSATDPPVPTPHPDSVEAETISRDEAPRYLWLLSVDPRIDQETERRAYEIFERKYGCRWVSPAVRGRASPCVPPPLDVAAVPTMTKQRALANLAMVSRGRRYAKSSGDDRLEDRLKVEFDILMQRVKMRD